MSYTFTTLTTAIKEYSENTEITFVNNLKNIVRSVEDRIFTLVDLEVFRKKIELISELKFSNELTSSKTSFKN